MNSTENNLYRLQALMEEIKAIREIYERLRAEHRDLAEDLRVIKENKFITHRKLLLKNKYFGD